MCSTLKLSVVIPTKNRQDDLLNAISSLANQKLLPFELVIIDQSFAPLNDKLLSQYFINKNVSIKYIYNKNIASLVEAKNHSLSHITGDIICFLEDDVILEREYLFEIAKGFIDNPKMIGCSGVISNHPKTTYFKLLIFNLFHLGIFKDPRLSIFIQNHSGFSNNLIPSQAISGGLSAWRFFIFQHILLSRNANFFMLEDIEFSTRVFKSYPKSLFINPNARLMHLWSPKNRNDNFARMQIKIIESYYFYKDRRKWKYSFASFIWLLLGFFFEAVLQSLTLRSSTPITNFLNGLKKIYQNE